MSAGLIIDPGGETVVVAITSASAGATISLYSDVNATSALANPLTITTVTKVFVRERTVQALVSLKVGGVEYGTAAGAALPYTFSDEGIGSCSPVVSSEIHQTTSAGTSLTTPTLEELSQGVTLPASITGAATVLLMTAMTDCRVPAISLIEQGGIAASDTNYWTVSLVKITGGKTLTIATKTTKVTGGQAVTTLAEWSFSTSEFHAVNARLRTGDVLALSFAATGSPSAWGSAVATWRYEPGVTVLGLDTFTRADSASVLGSTEVGAKAWVMDRGTWGISSGAAYTSASAGTRDFAVVDTGLADCTVQAQLVDITVSTGLAVRMSDGLNGWTVNGSALFKLVAGGLTQVGTFSVSGTAGDYYSIKMSGNTYTCYINGVSVLSYTDATNFNSTVTRHGLRTNPSTATRFDNFAWAA